MAAIILTLPKSIEVKKEKETKNLEQTLVPKEGSSNDQEGT